MVTFPSGIHSVLAVLMPLLVMDPEPEEDDEEDLELSVSSSSATPPDLVLVDEDTTGC